MQSLGSSAATKLEGSSDRERDERAREEAENKEREARELADKERKKAEQGRAKAAAEAQKKRQEKEKQRQEVLKRAQQKPETEQSNSAYGSLCLSQITSDCGLQSLAALGRQSVKGFIYTHGQ